MYASESSDFLPISNLLIIQYTIYIISLKYKMVNMLTLLLRSACWSGCLRPSPACTGEAAQAHHVAEPKIKKKIHK